MAGEPRFPRIPCDRVLVVNDNRDMLEMLQEALGMRGVEVRIATSVAEADRILGGGFAPDAVIVDLWLGDGTSGRDFVEWLRGDPRFENVPVVAMSGAVQELREPDPRIDRKLEKPFDLDELFQVLSELCAE